MTPAILTSTVDSVITDVSAVVTAGVSYMGDAATAITSSPLLMFFTCASMIGVGLGLLKRAIS